DAVRGVVQLRVSNRAAAVNRIKVETWRSRIRGGLRLCRHAERGPRVKGHVVVEELPHEGGPRRVGRVVPIVGAESGVDDQRYGAGGQVIVGVEDSSGLADVHERRSYDVRRGCERGKGRKYPSEVLGMG